MATATTTTSPINPATEDEHEQLKRFQIELEFVQCLSNPWYLHNLAQQQYFRKPEFVAYLDYLQYFRKPEYARFIIYPHCLHFLTLLQQPLFREALLKQETATFVHEKQYYHWLYFRNQDKVTRKVIGPDGVATEIPQDQDLQLQLQAPSIVAEAEAAAAAAAAAGNTSTSNMASGQAAAGAPTATTTTTATSTSTAGMVVQNGPVLHPGTLPPGGGVNGAVMIKTEQ